MNAELRYVRLKHTFFVRFVSGWGLAIDLISHLDERGVFYKLKPKIRLTTELLECHKAACTETEAALGMLFIRWLEAYMRVEKVVAKRVRVLTLLQRHLRNNIYLVETDTSPPKLAGSFPIL